MKLTLAHETPTLKSTPGRMCCDDGWCCFTMEIGRPLRHGTYTVSTGFSAALMRPLLVFKNDAGEIIGFIHPGTQDRHAPDHMLIGLDRAVDLVVDSLRAYRELSERVEDAEKNFGEVVSIEVFALQQKAYE